jgi:hypothetical protein
MDASNPPNEAPAAPHSDRQSETASRRRRQLIEAAAVAGELTAALIADSRQLIARSTHLIARPHMAIASSADTTPVRQPITCEQCGLGIDTPGVAIVRGRNVLHVRCA